MGQILESHRLSLARKALALRRFCKLPEAINQNPLEQSE